jgi:hypothetical protein
MCGLLGWIWILTDTIRENRKNRPVVLGALTVALFLGFLLIAEFSSNSHLRWLVDLLIATVIGAGICILLLVAQDVVRWGRR